MVDNLGDTLVRYRDALKSPAVRQLNRDWALVTFTVLTEVFDEHRGSLHSDELHQRVALCFDALRGSALPEGSNVSLPNSSSEIRDRVNDWVKSELLHRYDEEDGHHYRLTGHAASVRQYLDGIHESQRDDRSYASGQSALHLVHLGRELALAVAPSPEAKREQLDERRAQLRAELDSIEQQIHSIDRGEGVTPEPIHVVLDKYQHFADAVNAMLANMKLVEQQIDHLGSTIREAFSVEDRPHGEILTEYMDRLDDALNSSAGLGFIAAYEVLAETDLFDSLLRSSMSHELMQKLTATQARQFRTIPTQLRTAMSDVMAVQGRTDRRVHSFLQTYEPQTDRQISHLLQSCHRMLAELSRTAQVGAELNVPSDESLRDEGQWPTDRFAMPFLSLELDTSPAATPIKIKIADAPRKEPDKKEFEHILALGAPHEKAIHRVINDLLHQTSHPVSGQEIFGRLDPKDSRVVDLAGLIRIAAETSEALLDDESSVRYRTHQFEGAPIEYMAPEISFTSRAQEGNDDND